MDQWLIPMDQWMIPMDQWMIPMSQVDQKMVTAIYVDPFVIVRLTHPFWVKY